MECHPGQQRETTAPCPPALRAGERLGAKICFPGKGHSRELPRRGDIHRQTGELDRWERVGEGARDEWDRRVTEASLCHRAQVWAQRPGANPTTPRGCKALVPRVVPGAAQAASPAGSPGVQVEDLLGQVAGALEQRPDLQGGEVEGEAAGGEHQGLPGEEQSPGTERQQQVHSALRPPAAGLRDPRGTALPCPTRLPGHRRRREGSAGLVLSTHGCTAGADKSRSGGCVRPALSEHPKAHNPLGRRPCASHLGAVPCTQTGSARQSPAGHPAAKRGPARPAPRPQRCPCPCRTHGFQPGFLRCASRAPARAAGILSRGCCRHTPGASGTYGLLEARVELHSFQHPRK